MACVAATRGRASIKIFCESKEESQIAAEMHPWPLKNSSNLPALLIRKQHTSLSPAGHGNFFIIKVFGL
ncbi:MAG: hypothetical protein A2X49_16075 [Lentisphaerae bacterium GWF2_52_8]|nr:MAG: hypothetical protein A2X49_16075 [Lentisphaerae bacterium GWF2_52_8]